MNGNLAVVGTSVAAEGDAPLRSSPGRVSHRFAHIDTLRAVAALLVFLAHVSERFSPLARAPGPGLSFPVLARVFKLGRLGVLLFFIISGFVIYASLRGPREYAGRRFVITRFFRLYPAYWLSLAVGLLVFWWYRGQTFGPVLILANATMLPRLLHAPLVLGVYWTLETELAFYALCWALWRGGWLENRRVLVGLIVGLSAAWLVLCVLFQAHVLPANVPTPWKALPHHLAIMCWGAFFRVVYDETDGFRAAVAGNRQVWLLAGSGLLLMSLEGPKGFHISPGPLLIGPSAYVVAPVLFALWVAVWRVRWGALAWLGRISYSFYLFHLVVTVPLVTWLQSTSDGGWRGRPLALYMGAAFVLTTALSALVYYAVERPSIALGKRLAAPHAA